MTRGGDRIAVARNLDLPQALPPCCVCANPPALRSWRCPRPGAPLPGDPASPALAPGISRPAAPPLRGPRRPLPPPRPRAAAPRAASLGALGEHLPLAVPQRGEAATRPQPAGDAPPLGSPRPGAKFKNLTGAAGRLRKRK